MSSDIAATFQYDMPRKVVLENGQEFNVLTNDAVLSENEAIGGEELIDLLEIHFLALQLPTLPNESVMTVFSRDGKTSKQKISIYSKLSDDENELIVTVRAA